MNELEQDGNRVVVYDGRLSIYDRRPLLAYDTNDRSKVVEAAVGVDIDDKNVIGLLLKDGRFVDNLIDYLIANRIYDVCDIYGLIK